MGIFDPSADDGADMVSVGDRLAAERKRAGLSIETAAAACKVRADYLRAIERLDLSALPTLGYAIGYVRAYAISLGLEADPVVKAFKSEIEGHSKVSQRRFMRTVAIGSKSGVSAMPRGSVPALGVIAAVVMLGSWYGMQLETVASSGLDRPVMVNLNASTSEPSAPVSDSVLTLQTTAPSWVSIRNPKGRVIVNRVFVTGETWQVPVGEAYSVSVRDGGAVNVLRGERLIGPMGAPGEPVSDLDLRTIN